jgi:hypothetical protein
MLNFTLIRFYFVAAIVVLKFSERVCDDTLVKSHVFAVQKPSILVSYLKHHSFLGNANAVRCALLGWP